MRRQATLALHEGFAGHGQEGGGVIIELCEIAEEEQIKEVAQSSISDPRKVVVKYFGVILDVPLRRRRKGHRAKLSNYLIRELICSFLIAL